MSKHRAIEDHQTHGIDTGWSDIILICRKCSKKMKGGFGPDSKDSLRQAMRGALRERGQRGKVGLMDVACLGVCPKRAVTIARASQPGQLVIVPAGLAADKLLGWQARLTPPATTSCKDSSESALTPASDADSSYPKGL